MSAGHEHVDGTRGSDILDIYFLPCICLLQTCLCVVFVGHGFVLRSSAIQRDRMADLTQKRSIGRPFLGAGGVVSSQFLFLKL